MMVMFIIWSIQNFAPIFTLSNKDKIETCLYDNQCLTSCFRLQNQPITSHLSEF
jgi:hypothetical protein